MGQTDLYGSGSDIAAFRSAAGLPANSPHGHLDSRRYPTRELSPGISPRPAWTSSGRAPWPRTPRSFSSTGELTESSSAFQYAIDNNTAPVISISYGDCEADWGTANLNALAQLAQQANSQGQTIVAAAGDSGAADCDSSTLHHRVPSPRTAWPWMRPPVSPTLPGWAGANSTGLGKLLASRDARWRRYHHLRPFLYSRDGMERHVFTRKHRQRAAGRGRRSEHLTSRPSRPGRRGPACRTITLATCPTFP